jgi:hypothetical protein
MNEGCSCGDDQRFFGEEGFGKAISRQAEIIVHRR